MSPHSSMGTVALDVDHLTILQILAGLEGSQERGLRSLPWGLGACGHVLVPWDPNTFGRYFPCCVLLWSAHRTQPGRATVIL